MCKIGIVIYDFKLHRSQKSCYALRYNQLAIDNESGSSKAGLLSLPNSPRSDHSASTLNPSHQYLSSPSCFATTLEGPGALHHHTPTPIAVIIRLPILLVHHTRLVGVIVGRGDIASVLVETWHAIAHSSGVVDDDVRRIDAARGHTSTRAWIVDDNVWRARATAVYTDGGSRAATAGIGAPFAGEERGGDWRGAVDAAAGVHALHRSHSWKGGIDVHGWKVGVGRWSVVWDLREEVVVVGHCSCTGLLRLLDLVVNGGSDNCG